jgi:preprotein translocase subunit SecF
VANVALMLNLVMIIAVLSLLQATLTLPGIAGIVLTVGMAVDANVLIFERIKEELGVDSNIQKAIWPMVRSSIISMGAERDPALSNNAKLRASRALSRPEIRNRVENTP